MSLKNETVPLEWSRVETNERGCSFPWPVFEAEIGNQEYDRYFRSYGQLIVECASETFDEETVERALWCGFPGRRTIRNARHDVRRTRTYAVTTAELAAGTIPNPLVFAFNRGSQSLPTVAMYAPDQLIQFDFGEKVSGKLYTLDEATVSLDGVTQALFVFRDQAAIDELNGWQI